MQASVGAVVMWLVRCQLVASYLARALQMHAIMGWLPGGAAARVIHCELKTTWAQTVAAENLRLLSNAAG
jgi:hypothetical protein